MRPTLSLPDSPVPPALAIPNGDPRRQVIDYAQFLTVVTGGKVAAIVAVTNCLYKQFNLSSFGI